MLSANQKILISISLGILLAMVVFGLMLFTPWSSSDSSSEIEPKTEPREQCTDVSCDDFCTERGFVAGHKAGAETALECSDLNKPFYPGVNQNVPCTGATCCCTTDLQHRMKEIEDQCTSKCQNIAASASSLDKLQSVWEYCVAEYELPVANKSAPTEVLIDGVLGSDSFCREETHCFNLVPDIETCQYQGSPITASRCLTWMCEFQIKQGKQINEAEQVIRQAMSTTSCNLKTGEHGRVHYGLGVAEKIAIEPKWRSLFASPDCSNISVE